ncbi:hypothetical protein L3Y34_005240 [Caenorhabditis briggsae]|uniref:Uncharacterized protein n=1 Tax=Caenorhabditis briggsae TaxID=6238 RepID=A0AAE9AD72_CAEBR|nr:hypothetical protein L3Y34_005240 [Caenorhabditis briggsae]
MKHTLFTTLFLIYSTFHLPTVIPCEVTFVIETARNFNSSDIEKVLEKSVDSLSQCTRYCSSIQNCSHFTFSHAAEKNIISNCHLFRSTTYSSNSPHSIETTSGSLTVGTKTCLEIKCPKRSFSFEKFSEKSLLNSSFIIRTFSVPVEECLSKCQKDSSCRAALHNHVTSLCQLSRVSLNSVYNPRLYFKSSYSTDLYENNCIDYTMTSSGCTFMRVKGGGLKSVSDQLIQNVRSTEECEQMCVVRSRIADPCRSYTYDNSTMECHLMWSSVRMLGRSPLEVLKPNLFHGDLDDCVNFSLKCRENNLEIKASSMRMFIGKMMTKKSKKIMCEEAYQGEYDFSSKFDFKKCGLDEKKTKDSTYRGMVHVKEGSTSLVTIRDKMLQVNCHLHKSMPSEDKFLSVQMNVRENNKTNQVMSDAIIPTSTSSSPNTPKFSLKVLGLDSNEADTVHIGDFGWIVLNVRNSAEDFTVTNLVARDVISGLVLKIIDEDGCVLRRDIVKEIRKTDNYVKLKISFSGFRRQTEVVYHAMVETCTVGCMPKCNLDMMLPEEETNVHSGPLSLDLPRHRMVRRSLAGEPRELELTSDVYKVTGHKLTLLNPPLPEKAFDFKPPSKLQEEKEMQESLQEEFQDGDVIVVKHSTSLMSSVKTCLVDDVTCMLTVILGAIQMFLMFSCVLIMYCYYRQWRFYRELNRPPEHNVQYYQKPPEVIGQT